MNVAIITTVNHNVGDDFVREGILYLLERRFGKLKVFNIHKHIPVTVRKEFEWVYSLGLTRLIDKLPKVRGLYLSNILDAFPIIKSTDKILNSDLLIQSGAPVYWCHPGITHCGSNEWFRPLIQKRFLKINNQIPFLNLAAGSCQKYHSDGSEFDNCKSCQYYIKELQNLTKVTTIRDKLGKKILNNMGFDVPVIPCSSIFARESLGVKPDNPEYVALNYMKGGGHYGFGQKINFEKWENSFRTFYKKISKFETCVFVCHNHEEVNNAKRIDSNANIFISHDYKDYIKFYAKTKFGIMNRIHGAFPIASFGRPAVIVGNDSRAKMTEEIEMLHTFTNNAGLDWLLEAYEYLKNGGNNYSERFDVIKRKAYYDYQEALSVI